MKKKSVRRYVRIYAEHYGEPPYPCEFCDDEVVAFGLGIGLVHHRDGDRTNDDISNLTACHHSCHVEHHLAGRPKDPVAIAKTVATRMSRGYTHSAETRRKIGEGNRGKVGCKSMLGRHHTEETKAKMRAVVRKPLARVVCPHCGRESSAAGMVVHLRHNHIGEA